MLTTAERKCQAVALREPTGAEHYLIASVAHGAQSLPADEAAEAQANTTIKWCKKLAVEGPQAVDDLNLEQFQNLAIDFYAMLAKISESTDPKP